MPSLPLLCIARVDGDDSNEFCRAQIISYQAEGEAEGEEEDDEEGGGGGTKPIRWRVFFVDYGDYGYVSLAGTDLHVLNEALCMPARSLPFQAIECTLQDVIQSYRTTESKLESESVAAAAASSWPCEAGEHFWSPLTHETHTNKFEPVSAQILAVLASDYPDSRRRVYSVRLWREALSGLAARVDLGHALVADKFAGLTGSELARVFPATASGDHPPSSDTSSIARGLLENLLRQLVARALLSSVEDDAPEKENDCEEVRGWLERSAFLFRGGSIETRLNRLHSLLVTMCRLLPLLVSPLELFSYRGSKESEHRQVKTKELIIPSKF